MRRNCYHLCQTESLRPGLSSAHGHSVNYHNANCYNMHGHEVGGQLFGVRLKYLPYSSGKLARQLMTLLTSG